MKIASIFACVVVMLAVPTLAQAQGVVRGVQEGSREGNKAAGPVGGVVGGAVGGAVGGVAGGVKGVLGIPQNTRTKSKKAKPATP